MYIAEPRTRTKLNLAPRTKPVENQTPAQEPNSPPPAVVSSGAPAASIFGSAKPVDTSARERQIEERLAKQQEAPPQESSLESRREGSRRFVSIVKTSLYSRSVNKACWLCRV